MVTITKTEQSMNEWCAYTTCYFDDGSEPLKFTNYRDEWVPWKDSFLGLTREEADEQWTKRDVAYLRS